MPLVIEVDARSLDRNSVAPVVLVYRGPQHDKLYELRVSDQGVSPKLMKGSGDVAGDLAALSASAQVHILVESGLAKLRGP